MASLQRCATQDITDKPSARKTDGQTLMWSKPWSHRARIWPLCLTSSWGKGLGIRGSVGAFTCGCFHLGRGRPGNFATHCPQQRQLSWSCASSAAPIVRNFLSACLITLSFFVENKAALNYTYHMFPYLTSGRIFLAQLPKHPSIPAAISPAADSRQDQGLKVTGKCIHSTDQLPPGNAFREGL